MGERERRGRRSSPRLGGAATRAGRRRRWGASDPRGAGDPPWARDLRGQGDPRRRGSACAGATGKAPGDSSFLRPGALGFGAIPDCVIRASGPGDTGGGPSRGVLGRGPCLTAMLRPPERTGAGLEHCKAGRAAPFSPRSARTREGRSHDRERAIDAREPRSTWPPPRSLGRERSILPAFQRKRPSRRPP